MTGDGGNEVLHDTERTFGHTALKRNVEAAVALSEAVKSTLGPLGLDKMLVDDEGRVLVTNDGVTVLQTAKVEHPTANMIISSSSTQDRVARDGTTTTVLLTSEMLQNAWELVCQGVHPSIISRGFRMAETEVQKILLEIAKPVNGDAQILEATQTSLAGKGEASMRSKLAELAVMAAEGIAVEENGSIRANPTLVKVLAHKGSRAHESELVNGLVIAKKRIHSEMNSSLDSGKILLIDGALEKRKPSLDAKLKITSTGMLEAFRQKEHQILKDQIDMISALDADLLVVRDAVDDEAKHLLTQAGITCYRRVERVELELLARATDSRLVHSIESATKEDLGEFHSSQEVLWDDVTHWILEGKYRRGLTLISRGTTEEILEEVERAFNDALGVACQLHEEPLLLPGGGATQVALARRLRRFAETVAGREQLSIEAFADALEIIPRTLAENGGLDPIDKLLEITAAQTSVNEDVDWLGLDMKAKGVSDMDALAIREPLRITRQAIKGATESAISILRIDDVLWAKQDPTIPDGILEGNED